MKSEISIHLTLTEKEAVALKKVLGSLTDNQFLQICKIEGTELELMHEIYESLPFEEEEE